MFHFLINKLSYRVRLSNSQYLRNVHVHLDCIYLVSCILHDKMKSSAWFFLALIFLFCFFFSCGICRCEDALRLPAIEARVQPVSASLFCPSSRWCASLPPPPLPPWNVGAWCPRRPRQSGVFGNATWLIR